MEINDKYNRLTFTGKTDRDNRNKIKYVFRCDCGNEKTVYRSDVVSGKVKSCGCLLKEINKLSKTKHGSASKDSETYTEYKIWTGMKQRSYNQKSSRYEFYGAKGVKVCDRWLDKENGFSNFLADMGKRPTKKHSIDRKDSSGDYTPENCRWVTSTVQNRNKSSVVFIEYNGEKRPITEWAEILGISQKTLKTRLYTLNWSVESAFTTPVKDCGRHRK